VGWGIPSQGSFILKHVEKIPTIYFVNDNLMENYEKLDTVKLKKVDL
jgi:hypothetical protein